MAEQRRLDVWILSSNRFYRRVPFASVVDRVQRGLLLPNDRVRLTGDSDWQAVAEFRLLAPYVPQAEPFRAEDQAEALEPVELGLGPAMPHDDDEDDPDMIPLIDISLVLLVFFMMTAGSLIVASTVETPAAENARVRALKRNEIVTISVAMAGGQVRYFLGEESGQPIGEAELMNSVSDLVRQSASVEAVVKANPWVPYETIRQLLMGLESRGVKRIEAGVRDRRVEEEEP